MPKREGELTVSAALMAGMRAARARQSQAAAGRVLPQDEEYEAIEAVFVRMDKNEDGVVTRAQPGLRIAAQAPHLTRHSRLAGDELALELRKAAELELSDVRPRAPAVFRPLADCRSLAARRRMI